MPVDEVTITSRMFPLLSVTIWLTVPSVVPVLVLAVRPVVSPASEPLTTVPPARTLWKFACAIPVGDACSRPWLWSRAWLLSRAWEFGRQTRTGGYRRG